jgi:hypothetical protein
MTAKMNPAKLREKAKELIEQAAAEESRRQQLIGNMEVAFIEKDFKGFQPDLFKTQANEMWTKGKIGR